MAALVRALSAALDKEDWEDSGKAEGAQLWVDYATVAGGKTSRVYLAFAVKEDLAPFHEKPGKFDWFCMLLGLAGVAVVILAFLGLLSLIAAMA